MCLISNRFDWEKGGKGERKGERETYCPSRRVRISGYSSYEDGILARSK